MLCWLEQDGRNEVGLGCSLGTDRIRRRACIPDDLAVILRTKEYIVYDEWARLRGASICRTRESQGDLHIT